MNVPESMKVRRDRQRFLIKVYSLLSIMMAVTAGWCIHVHNRERIEKWYDRNEWSAAVSGIGCLVLAISLAFCYKTARMHPLRMIIFLLFAFGHVVFAAAFIEFVRREEITVSITVSAMAMYFGLAIYACFSHNDLSKIGALFTTAVMMVIAFILLNYALEIRRTAVFVIVIVMTLLSPWIVHNTYWLISGKYSRLPFEVDDYFLAAIIVYADTLSLPFYLLGLCFSPKTQE